MHAFTALVTKLLDPTWLLRLHRQLQFRVLARCGRGVHITHRAELLIHGSGSSVSIGAYAIVDGALECYERGLLVIGEHTFVGRSRIYAANEVRIGANVLISDNVAIMDSDLHPRNRRLRREQTRNVARGAFPDVYSDVEGAPVLIGDDVWIGYGATILKGVQIGEGAIIGARSLVIRDVRANSVVAGSPAAEIGSADVGN